MEKKLYIKSLSGASITAITYLPPKREVVVGHEDGLLKCWELETGRATHSNRKHRGWVSQLIYWNEGKILFSGSIDKTIVQWSSSLEPFHTIELSGPVHSLLWNPRRDILMCGKKESVGYINFSGGNASNGLPLLSHIEHKMEGHSDIIKCLACIDHRAYSAGFDKKLVIYEVSTLPGSLPLQISSIIHAHDAGITSLIVVKDADSSTWLATGSFDEKVKIWTAEGKLMHQISCYSVVTGLSYVIPSRVLWVAASGPTPLFFDPKLGVNVTQYVPVLGDDKVDKNSSVKSLTFFPEISEVIGFTNCKEILSWRYSTHCSICKMNSPTPAHIETITFTSKSPILIFSASYDGVITKWERHQLNQFLYSSETVQYRDTLVCHLMSEESEWNMLDIVKGESWNKVENKSATDKIKARCRKELMTETYRGFVKSLFIESLDFLIASSLDGKIFIWGYDEMNVDFLINIQLLESDRRAASIAAESDVTRRVVGFTCLKVLNGHSSSVSGLTVVEKNGQTYLVSGGWDGFICVWDLNKKSMISRVNHSNSGLSILSEDAIITDMDYSQEHDLVAYSTSDCSIHLCQFNTKGTGLRVKSSLLGHNEEVTQVKWNKFLDKWVTCSEDGTIRIWGAKGGSDSEMVVQVGGPASTLAIDMTYGYILVAVSNVIKLYDKNLEVIQVNRGHTDSIQSIVHVPEQDQYVSAGWDRTMRIWRAYHPRHTHFNGVT